MRKVFEGLRPPPYDLWEDGHSHIEPEPSVVVGGSLSGRRKRRGSKKRRGSRKKESN